MDIKYIRLFTVAIFSLIFTYSFAGRIDKTSSIHTPEGGSPVLIGTPTAIDSVEVSAPATNQKDYNLLNRISFGVDIQYPEFVAGQQKVKVSIHVERFDATNTALTPLDFFLEIDYSHSDTLHSLILDYHDFGEAYFMVYRIDSIWVDDVLTNTLPKNLFVQGDIFVERYTTLDVSSEVSSGITFIDTDHNNVKDGIEFFWLEFPGAEEYELEFLHISNFGSSGTTLSPSNLSYDFRNNSTRITTSELNYSIALVFNKGWVAYRVRPVGVDIDDPDHLVYGKWNALRSGKISALNSPSKLEITTSHAHEASLNWQYSATYGENGKRKELISYADGTLRSRQAVTKINSNDNVVVGETVYDYLGRPVINILPTPVERNASDTAILKYYPSFNRNLQETPYSKKDFVDLEGSCGLNAEGMSTSSGASRYYSSENTNQELHQAYVPDAGGFPFQQVEYTADKTGRINRQGGVGAQFQIGSGKETRYIYGSPSQLELNRMFGSEVGYKEHYQKNAVIDANGQASVSYVDITDRVIATALAGSSPNNLSNVGEAEDQWLEINQILPDGSNQEIDGLNNSLTFSSSFILTSPSDVAINYEFLTFPMQDSCLLEICLDCVYDLELTLRDECGENLLPDSLQQRMIGNFLLDEGQLVFHTECKDSTSFQALVEIPSLPIGKYTISKKLVINEKALNSYLALMDSSSCVLSYNDFLAEEMAAIDTLACEISCDNCLENLGTISDYIGNGHGTAAEYYYEVEECQKLCKDKVSDCEMYFTTLLIDMAPNGQYAKYLNENGEEVWTEPLSILNPNNLLLEAGASWKNPKLITSNGISPIYVDDAGVRSRVYLTEDPDFPGEYLPRPASNNFTIYDAELEQYYVYPENLKNVEDFVYYFEFSWANSLVYYHPEYCYYETCIKHEEKHTESDDFSSTSFDDLLQGTTSFQQAKVLGFINSNGQPSDWFTSSTNHPWDPFVYHSSDFETSSCSGFAQDLVTKFTKYQFILGEWYSMADIAAYTIRCGSDLSQQPDPSCFSFGQPYSGVEEMDTVIWNKEWNVFKALYLSAKQEYKQSLANCLAIKECKSYNGCVGEDNFNPFPEFFNLFAPLPFSNHPFFDPLQPCSYFSYSLYKDKIKRFPNSKDVEQYSANNTSYELYLQTGQCPNAFVLENLLNELVEKDKLTEVDFNLNSTDFLSALFQADNNYNNPGPIPNLTYNANSTSTTLTAEWKSLPNNDLYATLVLEKSTLINWADLTGIINLQATGTHSFIAEATYMDIDTLKSFVINGNLTPQISTQFKLDDCTFSQECSSSQLALDLTGLFNILNLNNDLFSTTPISISPYSPLNANLATLYIENAAGMGSNLSFIYDNINERMRIYDQYAQSNDGLYIDFLDVSGTLYNPNDITGVEIMTSTGSHSFELVAHQLVGGDLVFSGVLYQMRNGEKIGLSAGKCDLPTPMACQGKAYEAFDDIQLLLEDVLVNYNGTTDINLYSSIHITPSIVFSLPYDITHTTSEELGDSLIISAGDCDMILSLKDNSLSLQFKDLVEFSSFELMGENNFDLGYNDFYFIGSFETLQGTVSDTVFGSTCFTLKDCYPCASSSTSSTIPLGKLVPFPPQHENEFNNVSPNSFSTELMDSLKNNLFLFDSLMNQEDSLFTPMAIQPSCGGIPQEFIDCVDWFNNQDSPYKLDSMFVMTEFLEAFGWCDCLDDLCTVLHQIINEEIDIIAELGFETQEGGEYSPILLVIYLANKTNCKSCFLKELNFNFCYIRFLLNYDGPFINELFNREIPKLDCDCGDDLYCSVLDYILEGNVEFSTWEEMEKFLDYKRNCRECSKEYLEYSAIITTFNNSGYPYTITPMSRGLFVAYDYCDCVDAYQLILDDILLNNIEFTTQEEFNRYVSLHRICGENTINTPEDPCTDAYSQYIECGLHFVKKIKGQLELNVLKYEDFDSLQLCSCVDAYCSALDAVLAGIISFESQEAFDDYILNALDCNRKPDCKPVPSSGITPEMPVVEVENDCIETAKNLAVTNAQNAFDQYMDSVHTVNREKYVSYCMQTQEKLFTNYDDRQHHYTLYYYDQAGNLIKTIPPAGVELLDYTSTNDPLDLKINEDRDNGTKTVFTNHRLQTRYEYNSLNQLVAQYTPDTDAMEAFTLNLPNGLNAQLVTEKIQMLSESLGYLAGYVGDRGYLYKTMDGGKTWNRVSNLLGADLKKIKMIDALTGIAIGEFGTVLKTTDGGTSWDMVISWDTPEMIESLNDIAVNNFGDSIMIVGDNGLVALCTDFSSATPSFSIVNNSIVGNVLGVEYVSSRFVSTAHDELENISRFYTFDSNTLSWEVFETMMNNNFTSIDLFTNNKAYAADNDGRIYENKSLSAIDSKWIHKSSNLKEEIHEIRFFDENQGIALVSEGSEKKLYRTIDGARTWTKISDSLFTTITIAIDRSIISAGGENGNLVLLFPYQSGTEEISMVDVPNSSTITSLWIGETGSNMSVIAAFDDNTLFYTNNVFTTYPNWISTSSAQLGASIKKIAVSESSGTLRGVLITGNNQASDLSISGNNIAIGNTLSGNYTDVSEGSNYFYLTRSNGELTRKNKNGGSTLANLGQLPFNANLISAKGLELLVGLNDPSGNVGLAYVKLMNNGSTVASTADHTQKVYPDKLNGLVKISNEEILAYGNDGFLQLLIIGNNAYSIRLSHLENRNILDVTYHQNKLYVVGEDGLAIEGEPYPLGIHSTDLQTTGGTVSSVTSSDLHAITITQDNRMYIAGENGTVLYSPIATGSGSMPLNLLNQGNVDFYDILEIPNQNGRVFIAGENGRIQTQIGAMQLINNHIFIPPLRDVHFRNVGEATVVADNFVMRSTLTGGNKWGIILPESGSNSNNKYNKAWTLENGQSLLFGEGHTLLAKAHLPAQVAFSANNTTSLSKGRNNNEIYFADEGTIKRLSLTNTSVPIAISNTGTTDSIFGLHVFDNGDFIAVGENGFYKHYKAETNSFLNYSGPNTNGNLRAITFTDRLTGVIVGDYHSNGTYFTTQNQGISPLGYLESAHWESKPVLGVGIDPNHLTEGSINTISAASSTYFLFGGSSPSSQLHPYVRGVYDAGDRYSNRFYYDRLGRLVVSQNARQEAENKYSYTLFDALGRTIEVGEKTENSNQNEKRFKDIFGTLINGYLNPMAIDDGKLSDWISGNGVRKEVTRSYYDSVTIAGLPSIISSDLTTQRHRIIHVTYEEIFDNNDQTFDHATHYSYDIHGNVKTLLQDNKKMATNFPSLASQRFRRMDYAYDLLSGNVNRMSVQNGEVDQWHHAYFYDADNRIQRVYTNTKTPLTPINRLSQNMANELEHNSDWQMDAHYYYYDHGPLARIEIGENNLQGVDYYYNLQGWLKGVNSSVLNDENDPGMDSNPSEINALFAKDVFGFGLSYYENDYTAISGASTSSAPSPIASVNNTSHAAQNSADLYNGNIRYMQTAITNPLDRTKMPMLNAYKYDQLNRLNESRSYENGLNGNTWNPTSYGNEYYNAFTYDAMGNILTQKRHLRDGTQIEDLTYRYRYDNNNKLLRNRLYHINDNIAPNVDSTDLDDQGVFNSDPDFIETANNYVRDKMGRLVKDKQEEIDTVIWTASNKVKEIRRTFASNKKNVIFDYDAMGNQIAKHVYNNQSLMLEQSTYYILDAQGNQLSIYEHSVDSVSGSVYYYLTDRNIYGSSRLGVTKDTLNMFNPSVLQSYGVLGNRNYELTDHRGNVQTVINDIKYPLSSDNTSIDSYEVGINSVADYSPFGVELDGRTIDNIFHHPSQNNGSQTQADTVEIYNNDFDNPPATASPYYSTEVTLDAHLSNTNWTSSTGAFTNYNSSGAGSGKSIAITTASADTAYLTLTMDVDSGYELDITSYSFAHRSSATGYDSYTLVVNGIEIGSGSIYVASSGSTLQSTGVVDVSNPISGQTGTVGVVLKLYGGTHGHSGTFRMDDFVLNGYVQEESSGYSSSDYFVSRNHRYSFQNQEHHDEIRGKGNYINYKYRGYDPRVGRLDWLVDPLAKDYPWNSPYAFSENRVLDAIELEGAESLSTHKADFFIAFRINLPDGQEVNVYKSNKSNAYAIKPNDRSLINSFHESGFSAMSGHKDESTYVDRNASLPIVAGSGGADYYEEDLYRQFYKTKIIVPNEVTQTRTFTTILPQTLGVPGQGVVTSDARTPVPISTSNEASQINGITAQFERIKNVINSSVKSSSNNVLTGLSIDYNPNITNRAFDNLQNQANQLSEELGVSVDINANSSLESHAITNNVQVRYNQSISETSTIRISTIEEVKQ